MVCSTLEDYLVQPNASFTKVSEVVVVLLVCGEMWIPR